MSQTATVPQISPEVDSLFCSSILVKVYCRECIGASCPKNECKMIPIPFVHAESACVQLLTQEFAVRA